MLSAGWQGALLALYLSAGESVVTEPAFPNVTEAFCCAPPGLAAGMLAVGLGPHERVGRAHFVYPSPAEVSPEMLLRDVGEHCGE